MMKDNHVRKRTVSICVAGLVAALYIVLTILGGEFSVGPIQVRFSEALCVLPAFLPMTIPALTVGCFVSNLLLGCLWQDVVFGTLATLIGACGAYLLRRIPWLVPLPTVLANTLIVPFVLAYAYHTEGGIGWLFLSIGAGEVASAYILGMALLILLRRTGVLEKIQRTDNYS